MRAACFPITPLRVAGGLSLVRPLTLGSGGSLAYFLLSVRAQWHHGRGDVEYQRWLLAHKELTRRRTIISTGEFPPLLYRRGDPDQIISVLLKGFRRRVQEAASPADLRALLPEA